MSVWSWQPQLGSCAQDEDEEDIGGFDPEDDEDIGGFDPACFGTVTEVNGAGYIRGVHGMRMGITIGMGML